MTNKDWFKNLFINEAKSALSANSSANPEQINAAVKEYLDENQISSGKAVIENGVLKVT